MSPRAAEARALQAAKARLDRLALYPRPVRIARVRILTVPWLFRLPWFRRFAGYATYGLILLREPLSPASGDLVCHELCHVWQLQHQPVAMPLSYLRGYADNRYEREARAAVAATAAAPAPDQPSGASPAASAAGAKPAQRATGRRG